MVNLSKKAQKDLLNLDRSQRSRVEARIDRLAETADVTLLAKPLLGDLADAFTTRSGKVRIIFQIDSHKKQLDVLAIDFRREVYRVAKRRR